MVDLASVDWTLAAASLLAVATIALVIVTFRLGTITLRLADANKEIGRIDRIRMKDARAERQLQLRTEMVDLAESILRMKPDTWIRVCKAGPSP